jgi:hypothetical protein
MPGRVPTAQIVVAYAGALYDIVAFGGPDIQPDVRQALASLPPWGVDLTVPITAASEVPSVQAGSAVAPTRRQTHAIHIEMRGLDTPPGVGYSGTVGIPPGVGSVPRIEHGGPDYAS